MNDPSDMSTFQWSLFTPPNRGVSQAREPSVFSPPFQHGQPTSRDAAVAIRPVAGTLRARVLAAIEAAPAGLTDEEGCRVTGMNPSTWRPRRGELLEAGLIRDTGRTRKSTSGRDMTIWQAAGAAAAGERDGG